MPAYERGIFGWIRPAMWVDLNMLVYDHDTKTLTAGLNWYQFASQQYTLTLTGSNTFTGQAALGLICCFPQSF